ncbi:MAG: hypothetical protein RLN88_12745 [Ekhidna sp.]|uniref:hypothetical protein n=1 Tax=Ekhidna sp. TaxID=2608089 RepID=UPI0032ED2F59
MELLIITAVKAFEEDIKKLLRNNQVKAYSHMDVNGYKDLSEESQEDNWFASGTGEHRSSLFYAFVAKQHVDAVLDAIKKLNDEQESKSHVHALVLDIKKSI